MSALNSMILLKLIIRWEISKLVNRLKFIILVENSLMNKDLFEAQKNSNYDKLYLESDGFDENENKKEYPEEFKELLKEFENT